MFFLIRIRIVIAFGYKKSTMVEVINRVMTANKLKTIYWTVILQQNRTFSNKKSWKL